MYQIKIITDGLATELDIFDDELLSLNYQISDVREFEKRTANFSKTIKIPSSKNNDSVLEHIFEVTASTWGFNPNKRVLAQISYNSNVVFQGYMQLISIIDDAGTREYEVTILGGLDNFYKMIEGVKLSELDFSEFNHTYNKTNIVNSWDKSIIKNNKSIPFLKGMGYVYPLEDRGLTSGSRFTTEMFFPAFYVKTYLDKLFRLANYTYESNFFESDYFKSLIIPHSGSGNGKLTLSDEQIKIRLFKATRTTNNVLWKSADKNADYGIGTTNPGVLDVTSTTNNNQPVKVFRFNNDSILPNFDNSNVYDPATGVYTVNKNGQYKLSGKINTRLTIIPEILTSTWYWIGKDPIIYCRIVNITTGQTLFENSVAIVVPSTVFGVNTNYTTTIEIPFNFEGTLTVGHKFRVEAAFTLKRDTYQKSNMAYSWIDGIGPKGAFFRFEHLSGAEFFNEDNGSTLLEGETMVMNNLTIKDMTCQQLFNNLSKMFNLFILETNERKLKIEPRDLFFEGGKTLNWSKKLDTGREQVQIPLSELDFKTWNLSYTEDDDRYNKAYKDDFQRIYGERVVEIDNDFRNEKKEVKLTFSPTPSIRFNNTNLIIPSYTKLNGNIPEGKVPKPRILFYGGLKDGAFIFNGSKHSQYPYAGHFDDPLSPQEDLNWGIQKRYFNSPLTITTANLYNRFYRNTFDEIADKDAKLLIAYFWLKPIDMLNFDYRDVIFVNNQAYKMNKIIDYHPSARSLTKVELLKVKPNSLYKVRSASTTKGSAGGKDGKGGMVFKERELLFDGGGRIVKQDEELFDAQPYFERVVSPMDKNTFEENNQTISIKGTNNFIGSESTAVTISGSYNYVGNDTKNITILSSDNVYIAPNLENVTVINTSNVKVTESNTTINGGIVSTDYLVINGGTNNSLNYSTEDSQLYKSNFDDDVTYKKEELYLNFIDVEPFIYVAPYPIKITSFTKNNAATVTFKVNGQPYQFESTINKFDELKVEVSVKTFVTLSTENLNEKTIGEFELLKSDYD
jgi:hypothetical protein